MAPPLPLRVRGPARHGLADTRYALALRALPPRVAAVQLRSRFRARRRGDLFSLTSATRPPDLARLLELARGRHYVVELGTGTAWTTIALAVSDRRRRVVSFDPCERPEREHYLTLIGVRTRERIEFVCAPGSAGPTTPRPAEMLYVDSSHEREQTVAELTAWLPALAPGALVVFDDYGHARYPGIAEAVAELGLEGERRGTLFVHRRGPEPIAADGALPGRR